jgi:hypothetical protein
MSSPHYRESPPGGENPKFWLAISIPIAHGIPDVALLKRWQSQSRRGHVARTSTICQLFPCSREAFSNPLEFGGIIPQI